eukprot:m.457450 g.457450  ORF g.457450 m.457450 type:complete len:371 (-) comp21264_c0_seq1:264-1376(-)
MMTAATASLALQTAGTIWREIRSFRSSRIIDRSSDSHHSQSTLANGLVMVCGGGPDYIVVGSVDVYEPDIGRQKAFAPMLKPRYKHTQSTLADGRVLVCGGDTGSKILHGTEIYDPQSDEWTPAAPMTHARAGHTQSTLLNGKVFVCGGHQAEQAEIYDPEADSWVPSSTLRRHRASQSTLLDGRVLVCGGFDEFRETVLQSVVAIDPTTGDITEMPDLLDRRMDHTQSTLLDGRVLVCGGKGGRGPLKSAEIYDPAANKWTLAPDIPRECDGHSQSTLTDGRVLLVGGQAKARHWNGHWESEVIFDDRVWCRRIHREFSVAARVWVITVLRCGLRSARVVGRHGLPRLPPELWCGILEMLKHTAMLKLS